LLVDDNAAFIQAATRYLSGLPRVEVVACATSAATGLAQAIASAPDLVLMDMAMPGMNGLEAVLRLKQRSDAPKAVIVSLHDSEVYRSGARTAGADAFVCKSDFVAEMPALLETLFPLDRP
jgi:DNA-binding NarL/FixJ family response regulator